MWKTSKLHFAMIEEKFNEKVEEAEIVEDYLKEILPKLVLSVNDTNNKS